MLRLACTAFSALLLWGADVPRAYRLRPEPTTPEEFPSGQTVPVLPSLPPPAEQQKPAGKADRLQPESRLAIIRFVSGEFARALKSLPGGKRGFHIKAGQPLDEKALEMALATNGPAVNAGDTVQVTGLEFRDTQIVLDLNGGGRKKTRWRDRIQIGIGGSPMPTARTTASDASSAPGIRGTGSTLFLEFGRPLPDMTPEELKNNLAKVLDFSRQRSAAVQWVETLPPEIQKAIKEKRAMVGMDREMVIAALGKPERKIRERDANGAEIEDWIYGEPPSKTIFVRFAGDKVVTIKQYP